MGSAPLDLHVKLEKDGGVRKPEIGHNGRRLGIALEILYPAQCGGSCSRRTLHSRHTYQVGQAH
jgi:hypothetical protein